MFKIEGASEVIGDFERSATEVPRNIAEETQKTLKQIENTAKSIGTEVWIKRPQVSVPTISVGETNSGGFVGVYSRGGFFQEVGTVNHPPKPALQPALDAHKDEYLRRVEKLVDES